MWVNKGNENYTDYLTDEEYDYIHGTDSEKNEDEEDAYWDFMCDMENGK